MSKRTSNSTHKAGAARGWYWGGIIAGVVVLLAGIFVILRTKTQPTDNRSPTANGPSELQIPPRPDSLSLSVDSASAEHAIRVKAFDIAEQIAKAYPKNPIAVCLLAKAHLRSANDQAALGLWNYVLQIAPQNLEAQIDLGHLELQQGRFAESSNWFQQALKQDPNNADLYRSLAKCYANQGMIQEAIQTLEKVIQLGQESAIDWNLLAQHWLAIDQTEKAASAAEKSLAKSPKAADSLQTMIAVQRKLRNSELVQSYSKALSEIEPELIRTQTTNRAEADRQRIADFLEYSAMTASNIHMQAGNRVSGKQILQDAAQLLDKSPSLADAYARTLAAEGEIDQAIQVLKDNCRKNPLREDCWMSMGIFSLKNRKYGAAEIAFQRCLELNPNSDRVYAYLAQTWMPRERNPKEAVRFAKQALAHKPSADNHYVLANAYYYNQELGLAIQSLETAIALSPDNVEYRNALATLRSVKP